MTTYNVKTRSYVHGAEVTITFSNNVPININFNTRFVKKLTRATENMFQHAEISYCSDKTDKKYLRLILKIDPNRLTLPINNRYSTYNISLETTALKNSSKRKVLTEVFLKEIDELCNNQSSIIFKFSHKVANVLYFEFEKNVYNVIANDPTSIVLSKVMDNYDDQILKEMLIYNVPFA